MRKTWSFDTEDSIYAPKHKRLLIAFMLPLSGLRLERADARIVMRKRVVKSCGV